MSKIATLALIQFYTHIAIFYIKLIFKGYCDIINDHVFIKLSVHVYQC